MARRAFQRWCVRVAQARRRRRWLAAHRGRAVDVIVTHAEVNDRHGTGVLLQRLFAGAPDLVTLRSRDDYDARQDLGAFCARLPQPDQDPAAAVRRVEALLGGLTVRRVLAVPYRPDDVLTALALRERYGARLCTWLMDDRNVESQAIPDALLARLLERSALRLAISEELRQAYAQKYRLALALVPPVVDPALLPGGPCPAPPAALAGRRAVMIGNVWGQSWLRGLCRVLQGSGLELDWYSSSSLRWQALGEDDLRRAGIRWHPGPPDAELVAALRQAAFAVLPSGTLDPADDSRAIARFSLPSKLVYSTATAHLPVLVLGHRDTAAARFVRGAGIGLCAPYEAPAFAAAVAELLRPEVQARLRARAAALSPALSAAGVGDWIWRSLEAGRPADDRFAPLGF